MTHDSPADEFVTLFSDVFMHLHRRREATTYAPSRESLAVLRHLATAGPLTVQEASRHFGRSQAAMSEMIDRLIKRDLLARQIDDRDRRRHIVWLTEAGQRCVVQESQPLDSERLAEALADMTATERTALLDGFRRLAEVVRARAQRHRRQQ